MSRQQNAEGTEPSLRQQSCSESLVVHRRGKALSVLVCLTHLRPQLAIVVNVAQGELSGVWFMPCHQTLLKGPLLALHYALSESKCKGGVGTEEIWGQKELGNKVNFHAQHLEEPLDKLLCLQLSGREKRTEIE